MCVCVGEGGWGGAGRVLFDIMTYSAPSTPAPPNPAPPHVKHVVTKERFAPAALSVELFVNKRKMDKLEMNAFEQKQHLSC